MATAVPDAGRIDLAQLFQGGGETGALMRGLDWSTTALGPVEGWPEGLRVLVSSILNSHFPMVVAWGEHYVLLSNDAHRQIAGGRHPSTLGQRLKDAWPDEHLKLSAVLDPVYRDGRATQIENLPFLLNRHGFAEEAYFTASYSPIPDAARGQAGVLCFMLDSTAQVLGARRIQMLQRLMREAFAARTAHEAVARALEALASNPRDLPFALYYPLEQGAPAAGVVQLGCAAETWPWQELLRTRLPVEVATLPEAIRAALQGGLGAPCERAMLLPVTEPKQEAPEGFLVVGLSAQLALDATYRDFLMLASDHVATALANARAYEVEKHRADELAALRKQAEAERRKLFDLVAQAPVAMAVYRTDRFVFDLANARYLTMVNRPALVGERYFDAFPEMRRTAVQQVFEQVWRTGEPFFTAEMRADLSRDGGPPQETYWSWSLSALRRPEGDIDGLLGVAIDITESVQARQRLVQAQTERDELLVTERRARTEAENANRTKDEFLATVSHELRTPLTAILGYVGMLRSGALPEGKRGYAIEVIERQARIQAQLIEDLLDVSRIISGKLRLDVQQLKPIGAIEAALEAVRPAADARGIRLSSVLDPLAGPISGDPERLQQIVWNLLSNAIKFTPKEGRVRLSLARVNSHIEIMVSDSGPGIEPAFLPFVFDRFRQQDGSINRHHNGLGLGLAIVRHLTELHGGTVEVHNGGEEKGATFIVSLPLAAVINTPAGGVRVHPHERTTPAFAYPPALIGMEVLVVDDDDDTRGLLKELLEGCGLRVRAVPSVAAALQALDEAVPDLLVSDIGMPGEDGFSFIQKVRASPKPAVRALPAVALTAFARSEDRTRALTLGFNSHVPKPVEQSELVAVLVSLVRKQ